MTLLCSPFKESYPVSVVIIYSHPMFKAIRAFKPTHRTVYGAVPGLCLQSSGNFVQDHCKTHGKFLRNIKVPAADREALPCGAMTTSP